MHNKAFDTLLSDLAAVYAGSDPHDLLTKDVIPVEFHEANPEDIVRAYETFISKTPEAKVTSVKAKLAELNYHTPYDLFHDVKLACGIEIVKHAVGSDVYQEIDAFYMFCTNLLLQEVASMGLRLFQEKEREEDDELLDIFRDDFDKISSNHVSVNGEFVTYINKYTEPAVPTYHSAYNSQPEPESKTIVQPLFSGLVGRSTLDTRNTLVPEPWSLTKAVGLGANTHSTGTIKSFNSVACKIPLPSQASAQVLDGFFHPNWYTIESPKWLQYKQKTLKPPLNSTLVKNCEANELRVHEKKSNLVSLGPAVDSRNSVLSDELKQKIWYSNIGRKQVDEIKKKHAEESSTGENSAKTAKSASEAEPTETETGNEANEAENMEVDGEGKVITEDAEIKLENLALFVPEAVSSIEQLRTEKARVLKSPHEIQKVISLNLLKLNKLRQERYLHSTSPATPSLQETLLYKKVVKLLSLLARSNVANHKTLQLQLSKKIPVLLNDYEGVLPGPMPAKPVPTNKSGRLAGIKGPYKKKGRYS
ncbi:hypothetical protein JCM33374_g4852 [Metschnikowia sp. JCM 33374]|nr:hypothetical protein JCM33374_g4852 [Metschnikowia sp. JCM 33374]